MSVTRILIAFQDCLVDCTKVSLDTLLQRGVSL